MAMYVSNDGSFAVGHVDRVYRRRRTLQGRPQRYISQDPEWPKSGDPPPLGVTLKKVGKKLYMHAVWLPTCSSDGPMAMGVVLYININGPGHGITGSNTSVDVQGLPGAPT